MGFGGKGGGGKGGGRKSGGGDEGFGRGGGGDKTAPSLPGFSYTRDAVMPNFMQIMSGGGAKPNLGGIEGALQRHAEKERERGERERDEREDKDDEAPLVVDAADALTAKERAKLEGKPRSHSGGSLKFKEGDTSAAAKFTESAYERVTAEAARRAEAERAAANAKAEEVAAASGKAHLFNASGALGAQQKLKHAGKRKAGAEAGAAPKAKAVKNAKLLSFEEDDE